jgi:hypothetical protein
LTDERRAGARDRWLGIAARSRLVWSAILLVAGLALGFYFSSDANPEAAAALRDLRADATALHPYGPGRLEDRAEIGKSNGVVVGYRQTGIDDVSAAREYFASEFARLGYRPKDTDLGRSFVRDRFCRGAYEASTEHVTSEPTGIAIAFSWGDGVRCP